MATTETKEYVRTIMFGIIIAIVIYSFSEALFYLIIVIILGAIGVYYTLELT